MRRLCIILLFAGMAWGQGNICFIGDSLTAGYQSSPNIDPTLGIVANLSNSTGLSFTATNIGVTGSSTADWVGYISLGALSHCTSPTSTYAVIMLGANDAKTSIRTSTSQYQSNIQSIIASVKAVGINKIILDYTPYIDYTNAGAPQWDSTTDVLLLQYQTALQAIAAADHAHVFIGQTSAYAWFQANPTQLQDGVHPTGAPSNIGYNQLDIIRGQGLAQAVAAGSVVFLRSSAPQSQLITAMAPGPPAVITAAGAHLLPTTCGGSTTCYVIVGQVCDTSGLPSKANGIRQATWVSATQFSIATQSGTPITAGGAGQSCGVGMQAWMGLLTQFTLGPQPLAQLDGLYGTNNRKLALSTNNGLPSSGGVVVSGCPGACVVTVTTTYAHGVTPLSPGGKQEYFGIWGTTSNALNKAGTSTTGAPYQVASATTNTFTTTPVSGLSNGDYTNNLSCGANGVSFDAINGTENCVVVSQLAYNGTGAADNKYWDPIVNEVVSRLGINGTNIYYRHIFDGGGYTSGANFWGDFNSIAINFMVDRRNQSLLSALIYSLDYLPRGYGVNFTEDTDLNADATGGSAAFGISLQLQAAWKFLSPTERTTVLNMIYNDITDPLGGAVASIANTDIGYGKANTPVTSGTAQGGTGTTIKIATSDTQPDGYYNTTVISYFPPGGPYYCMGQIATYTKATKIATVPGGFFQRQQGSGGCAPPAAGSAYTVYAVASISAWPGTGPQNMLLADDIAMAGTSNTITLAASTGSVTSPAYLYIPSQYKVYPVSGYNSATRVLTISGAFTSTPAAGTAYAVFNANPTSTVTGLYTHFTTTLSPGDAVYISNGAENNGTIEGDYSYVLSVNSDTSLTVFNNAAPNGYLDYGQTGPMLVWSIHQWRPGDTGWTWLSHAAAEDPGATPAVSLPGGGYLSAGEGTNGPISFSDFQHMVTAFAVAPYDSRAVTELATYESQTFDYQIRHFLSWETGPGHDGNHYTFDVTQPGHRAAAWMIANSVASFPSMDLKGPWMQGPGIFKMFATLPDLALGGTPITMVLGDSGGFTNPGENGGTQLGWITDGTMTFAPTSQTAQFYRNFLETLLPPGSGSIPYFSWGAYIIPNNSILLLQNQPTIGSTDFTIQPHQYLFQATSQPTCASLTGWPCPVNFRGSLAISRTGFWSSANSTNGSRSDSHVTYGARSYCGDCNGYDYPESGHLQIYKVGDLIAGDYDPQNGGGFENADYTTDGGMLRFGNTDENVIYIGAILPQTPITMWASGNHGNWSTAYGDQASQYMWLCSSLGGAYSISINYANRCVLEFKGTGADHFVLQWTTASMPSGTTIQEHVHYAQNGETTANGPHIAYNEGNTTCPGSGGCAGLDTGRVIQSLESGISNGSSDPTPSYGIATHYMSPSSIFVTWDCPGGVECSANPSVRTYSGGWGHTDRVGVCAGSGSCSSSATSFESLQVHKIMPSVTDTILTTAVLSASDSAKFYHVQMSGSITSAVAVLPRGGTIYSSMASFTTTHSGIAQYILGGLTAGRYAVTVGGAAVAGSPFTVTDGDNSIEFTSTAGTVAVVVAVSQGTTLKGAAGASGGVIIH